MRTVPEFEWYHEFVDLSYKPSDRDLIALFKAKPDKGLSLEDVAGRIASESSVGTWTTLSLSGLNIKKLMAKAYKIKKDMIWISYPLELFEPGNIAQILSCIAGNIFGMRALKTLKLFDVSIPKELLLSFKGPNKGIKGVREILKIRKRPITATVPKPKVGLEVNKYSEVAYEILSGGIDLLKDDENLTSQNFNKFEKRLSSIMKVIEKVENDTGERKGYLINVTSSYREMERRAKLVSAYGNNFIMIDVVISGWSALQAMRDLAEELNLAIHAHRAFHAAFTRPKNHGMSMMALAKFLRLVGVDHLHIGNPLGKLEAMTAEVIELRNAITQDKFSPQNQIYLPQNWNTLLPVFPVISGGLHPGTIPEILKILGTDLILQVGGGVMGHPNGPHSGALAVRQAIEAYMRGIEIDEYAKKYKELNAALKKWGKIRPI